MQQPTDVVEDIVRANLIALALTVALRCAFVDGVSALEAIGIGVKMAGIQVVVSRWVAVGNRLNALRFPWVADR